MYCTLGLTTDTDFGYISDSVVKLRVGFNVFRRRLFSKRYTYIA